MLVLLEFQLQPFPLTYQIFAILMPWFDLFLQSLKLPPLSSLLFLFIKQILVLKLITPITPYQEKYAPVSATSSRDSSFQGDKPIFKCA